MPICLEFEYFDADSFGDEENLHEEDSILRRLEEGDITNHHATLLCEEVILEVLGYITRFSNYLSVLNRTRCTFGSSFEETIEALPILKAV